MSEESLVDFGFFEEEYNFFELSLGPSREIGLDYYQVYFMLSPEVRVHTRSIYTIWDLLGDIGGLLDMMIKLKSPLVSFFSFLLGISLE